VVQGQRHRVEFRKEVPPLNSGSTNNFLRRLRYTRRTGKDDSVAPFTSLLINNTTIVELLKWVLVVLHIITAAAWFGLGLRLTAWARKTAGLSGEAAVVMAEDGQRSVKLMTVFVVLTAVFSIAAFVIGGAFAVYGPAYHTSLLLIILLVLDHVLVIRPAWETLATAVSSAGPSSEGIKASAKKRVAIGTGIGHLMWLVMLILMFSQQWIAALG